MKKDIYKILKDIYGFDSFRKGQEELITHLIKGQDVVGIMPTAGGKSLCYQIPALALDGVTIVISPLISLMKDQVDTLCDMGINAAYINSSLTNKEITEIYDNAKSNVYKLIYVAPERLESHLFIELLNLIHVSLLAIDEAHCVSQWGHDFRPSYTKIAWVISNMEKRPVVAAFTATATEVVKQDIIKLLNLENPFTLVTGFDRENLFFKVAKPQNKFKYLENYLMENDNKSGIIYCSTRKTVESITSKLNHKGYQVTKYHAGLSEQERNQNQEAFLYDKKQIMVATNAFGMGIDKSNIRFIMHYNMPKDIESYYQEAGRAGRDGLYAECHLLFSASDIITNKLFINNNNDNADNAYKKLNKMVDYCHIDKCLRNYILSYFGEKSSTNSCEQCSNCKNDIELTVITQESQKIMSCMKRMGERFGASLVVDVLKGSKAKKIMDLGFDQLSTYGIMKDYHKDSIKEIISFLVSENYLQIAGTQYPVLTLNSKSFDVLLGKEVVKIKRVIEKVKTKDYIKHTPPYNNELFEELRALRKDLSTEENIPPFIIFSDASLQDMSRKYPTNDHEFLQVTGVGQYKLSKYGEVFIELIKNFMEENEVTRFEEESYKQNQKKDNKSKKTHIETYDLYNQGLSLEEIAEMRDIKVRTVSSHLMKCLEEGLMFDYEKLINTKYETQIIEVVKEFGNSKLKTIKDELPDEVTYNDIKFIILKHDL